MASPIRLTEFAESVGISVRMLRDYRRRKHNPMPGVAKQDGVLVVDPELALPWINDPDNSPRTQRRRSIELPQKNGAKVGKTKKKAAAGPKKQARKKPSEPAKEPEKHSEMLWSEAEEIRRLETVIDRLLSIIEAKEQVPPVILDRYVEMSKRRESLVKSEQANKEANEQFIERDRHRLIVQTLCTTIRMEIEAIPSVAADKVLDGFTESKLKVVTESGGRRDAKRSLRVVSEVLDDQVRDALSRITDAIEASDAQ